MYGTNPSPVNGQQSSTSTSQKHQSRRASQIPVTADELNRLRATIKANPADKATELMLAKRLAAAAITLVSPNQDAKTRAREREAYIREAEKHMKKLVGQNYTDAMFHLADCYGTGQMGLAVDPKEAFGLYQSAAKLGHAPSAYRTAVCCEMGSDSGGGTRKDPLKAVQWYRRAATLGDVPAMYKLGMIMLKGLLGQQASVGESMIWLQRAAQQADEENPHAVHELAQLYEMAPPGGNGKVIRDERYAFQLYEQAARLGYKLSQGRLGKAFEYGQLGQAINNRSSIHWYSKAAAQGDVEAELALSGWYLTGSEGILQQSDTEAYLWARKAAMKEFPKAEFAMGYFCEVGIGCPRALEDAKRWYGRAAGKSKLIPSPFIFLSMQKMVDES
jgi:TPR repeat protein